MPEENAQVTENTVLSSPLVIASAARQSVPNAARQSIPNPPPQSVEAPAQQSFEIPPFTPPPSAPAIALEPVIANVSTVIARSPQATRQSIPNPSQQFADAPPSPAIQSVTALNDRLAALAAENAAAVEILSQRHADLIALQGSHDSAVTAYRNLLISTNPAVFSEDCLPGVTIQEIEASAKKVNDIAAKVRAQFQADIKAVIVPAGAPERSGPDTSTLSSIDKIKYAIQNASSLRGTQ